jgi:hypothetical protein
MIGLMVSDAQRGSIASRILKVSTEVWTGVRHDADRLRVPPLSGKNSSASTLSVLPPCERRDSKGQRDVSGVVSGLWSERTNTGRPRRGVKGLEWKGAIEAKSGRFKILEFLVSATTALVGFFAVKFVAIRSSSFLTSPEWAAVCAWSSIIG